MPEYPHSFSSKRSTWEKFINKDNEISKILIRIFDGRDSVEISRSDLFRLAETEDYPLFIVSTIIWGYPGGMRGNHFETITNGIDRLVEMLKEAKFGVDDWNSHYAKTDAILGLGLSTYTKFLYFIRAKVSSIPCVILDQRIIDAINKGAINGFADLGRIAPHNAASKYPDFLRIIDAYSKKHMATHGQVEMFLFEFGVCIKAQA